MPLNITKTETKFVNLFTLTVFTLINMYLECLRLYVELIQIQFPNSLLFLKSRIFLICSSSPESKQWEIGGRIIQILCPYYLFLFFRL